MIGPFEIEEETEEEITTQVVAALRRMADAIGQLTEALPSLTEPFARGAQAVAILAADIADRIEGGEMDRLTDDEALVAGLADLPSEELLELAGELAAWSPQVFNPNERNAGGDDV